MKEPIRIKLSPENPVHKEPIKRELKPIDISGQDNDDMYRPIALEEIYKLLDEANENNSKNN
jgi:hypothetical protein